jgi:hypothetical protein
MVTEHLAVLVAGLGCGKHWWSERRHARVHDRGDGEFRPGVEIAVASVEHHAAFANAIVSAALQPPKLPRNKQSNIHIGRRVIGEINAEVIHPLIGQKFRETGVPLGPKLFEAGHDRMRCYAIIW